MLRLNEIDCSVEWMDTVEERIDGMTVLYHPAPTQSMNRCRKPYKIRLKFAQKDRLCNP